MLQSLELFGFKSFADRVKFDFDPGITCVVGPNGSGKSNVVDAIKWLLGDQSAKSLRGSEMSDVIFNGSAARGGSGYAEAILTFDNASGLIPFAAREVAVGRRLYRSGESEYLLNGDSVRLKDIRSLFLGTGAGSAAYSIIEQGRVGQILQSNPAARRAVFEEAAGVSKFKARRVECERRLARVATNLERLTDIVDETETRLAATRSQASKAAKYRELTNLLEEQWLGLAGDRYRVLSARVHEITEQESEDAAAERELSAAIETMAVEAKQLVEEQASAEYELSQCEARSVHTRETTAGLRSSLRANAEANSELELELSRVSKELWSERSSLRERHAEVNRSRDGVEFASKECDALAGEQQELVSSIAELEHKREEAENERVANAAIVDELDAERVTRADEQRRNEQRIEYVDREIESIDEQRAVLRETVQAVSLEVDAHREDAAVVDREHAAVRDRVVELRSMDEAFKQQLEHTKTILATAREDQTAARARLTVLRDLEPVSGNAVSVNEFVELAGQATGSPWDTVLGRVGDLIDCEAEFAPLIDLGLGPRAHFVATTDLDAVIEYLDQSHFELDGRIGFIEVRDTNVRSTHRRDDGFFESLDSLYDDSANIDLSHEQGVVGRLDTLVRGDERFAEAVLGDTWLVERIDHARALQRKYPRCRFLTRVGELIDSDGSAHFGQLPLHGALVGRRSEVRELRARVAHFGRTIEDAERRLETLESQRGNVRQELRSEEIRQPETVERAGRSRSSLATAIERLSERRSQLDAVEQKCVDLESERAELVVASDRVGSALARAESQKQVAVDALAGLEETIYELSRERAAAEEQLRDFSVRSATIEARRQSETDRLSQLQAEVSQSELRIGRLSSRSHDMHIKKSELLLARLNMRAARDEMAIEHEKQSVLLAQLRHAQRRIRAAVESVREKQSRADREHTETASRLAKNEMNLKEARADLERLAERCDEDFSLTLEEAGKAPSAYDAYCATLPDDVETPDFDEVADALEQDAQRTRRKIKSLGSVNTESLRDLDELESRFETLSAQLADLTTAKNTLEEIIDRTNTESRRIFSETFETVRGHFQELFRKCFGGGSADLILEDAEDVLDAGIDILARPPGKELRNLSLLSGGEKAMTAVALLMALFRAKPSPYCILDEVDAPLDEANIDRFLKVVREFREGTQFVVITHRRRTMTAADVVYGVTMETSGVSKRLAVNLDQVADDGTVREAA